MTKNRTIQMVTPIKILVMINNICSKENSNNDAYGDSNYYGNYVESNDSSFRNMQMNNRDHKCIDNSFNYNDDKLKSHYSCSGDQYK